MSDPDWAALMRSSLSHLLEKPLVIQPDMLIVPMGLESEARWLVEARMVDSIGNYRCYELDGERRWSRWLSLAGTPERWPREVWESEYDDEAVAVRFNRHARRRGWPATMPLWMWKKLRLEVK